MLQEVCSEALHKRFIVRLIGNVYAPSWFNIKSHPSCVDGSKNFFCPLKLCYNLGINDWKVLEPVLHNNNYFAHSENILLAGVRDNDDSVKQFCYEKIISSRSSSSSTDVRVFDKASIVLNASAMTYADMIDWSTIVVISPALLTAIDNDNLRQCQFHWFSGIPCHSQAVERAVRDLTAKVS